MNKTEKRIREILKSYYYRFYLIPKDQCKQKMLIRTLRKKGNASLAFLVSSLSMWRAQTLYDRLAKDGRFDLRIILFPFFSLSPIQRTSSIQQLRDYFSERSIPFLDLSGEVAPGQALREQVAPDILFYPQPYNDLYGNDLDAPFFEDKLLCYLPYAMLTSSEPWAYQCHLNNIAWRLFFQSESQKKEASAVLYNRGRNIRVVGESMSDLFSQPASQVIWKPQEKPKKKVIWAPHFTLSEDNFLHRDSFSWLSGFMLDVVERYRDTIQFAFKPHPRLLTVLYGRSDWGEERANHYYARWAEGANTQLETGSYIDLFKFSDAMIHDSSSFTVEYHFTGKPVLFTAPDLTPVTRILNDFGKDAVHAHYQAKNTEDILDFLDHVVLGGDDPMKEQRLAFFNKYLLPPGGKSVAENIYQEIVTSIWG